MSKRGGVSLVAYLWIAFAVNYVDRQMVYSMFPALRTELGFTDARLGLIGSVFLWVYLLGMPVAGRLADTMRREWMVVASLVLWSAATLGSGMSRSQGSDAGVASGHGLDRIAVLPGCACDDCELLPARNAIACSRDSSVGAACRCCDRRMVRRLVGRSHRVAPGLSLGWRLRNPVQRCAVASLWAVELRLRGTGIR